VFQRERVTRVRQLSAVMATTSSDIGHVQSIFLRRLCPIGRGAASQQASQSAANGAIQWPMAWELITKELDAAPEDGTAAAPTIVERLWRLVGLDRGLPRQTSVAFTIALVSLSAKLAKSDGVASRIESEVFERLHKVTPAERQNVRRVFDLAAQDVTGFTGTAEKVATLLRHDRDLMHDVLEGLFHIAAADGILHPEEERHLKMAAEAFGFSTESYRAMRALFIHDPDDPYTVLGLAPDVDAATLKARFRQLVREHHPDQLIARGVPPEYIKLATDKLAAINAAFDRIAQERGI
jgi:DnaJ like chaperone protein